LAVLAVRYYFRLVGRDDVFEDETGVLASSVDQAEAETLGVIDELRAHGQLPDISERWCLELHDNRGGHVLRSLPLF
jgi:hypothetical protein